MKLSRRHALGIALLTFFQSVHFRKEWICEIEIYRVRNFLYLFEKHEDGIFFRFVEVMINRIQVIILKDKINENNIR